MPPDQGAQRTRLLAAMGHGCRWGRPESVVSVERYRFNISQVVPSATLKGPRLRPAVGAGRQLGGAGWDGLTLFLGVGIYQADCDRRRQVRGSRNTAFIAASPSTVLGVPRRRLFFSCWMPALEQSR